jgi:hypothetical protein
MNTQDDKHWQSLASLSLPAYTGDGKAPYGLVTRTLARLRDEKRQQEVLERIGLRAILAALAALAITTCVTLTLQWSLNTGDLDPGTNSLMQVATVQIS